MKSSLALNFGKLDEKLEKRPVTMPCGFSRVPLVFLGIIPDNRINTSLVGLFGMQITKTPNCPVTIVPISTLHYLITSTNATDRYDIRYGRPISIVRSDSLG